METSFVNKVARAILEGGGFMIDDEEMEWAQGAAKAAIEAMRSPTDEMRVAALSATHDEKVGDRVHCLDVPIVWQAMIDKALEGKDASIRK